MDFATHAAVGALTGRALAPAGADPALARRLSRLGAVAALLPDADHVLEVLSAELYLVHHRTFTHSLLGVGALALAAAAVARRGSAKEATGLTPRRALAVSAAALGTHLLLDVATPFGTALLWPFSGWLAASDGLPIVAPWLLALTVALAMWAGLRGRRDAAAGRRAARGALGGLGALLLATHALAAWGAARAPGGPAALAVPRWTFPHTSDALVREGEHVAHYQVGPLRPPELIQRLPRMAGPDGEPWRAPFTPPPEVPLDRLRVPIAAVESGSVVYWDAQFATIDRDRRPIYVAVDLESGRYEVHQLARGSQLLLWALVLGGAWFMTAPPRRPAAGMPMASN